MCDSWPVNQPDYPRGVSQRVFHPDIREFKKPRRLLKRKRHFKIELCVGLSVLRLFHVGHDVQNRRSTLSLV